MSTEVLHVRLTSVDIGTRVEEHCLATLETVRGVEIFNVRVHLVGKHVAAWKSRRQLARELVGLLHSSTSLRLNPINNAVLTAN